MQVNFLIGFPASGKSTVAAEYSKNNFVILNRDTEGGKLTKLCGMLESALQAGRDVVLDNTFPTKESRRIFINIAKKFDAQCIALVMSTGAEDAQINALNRMWERYGKIYLDYESMKGSKDPNLFPPAAIFSYRSQFQYPEFAEGFDKIEKINFRRKLHTGKNKALILDYDGTLRESLGSEKFPLKPGEVKAFKNRAEKLIEYRDKGYLLLGVSNQSAISKGLLTEQDAIACFEETNKQLGVNIDYYFCKHSIPPVRCYCRKPQAGLGMLLIKKFDLNEKECVMVGDMTSDKTFATRLGIPFIHESKFFNEDKS